MKKVFNIFICFAFLLGLCQQAIYPAQAAPLAYTMIATPNYVHPGGTVRVSGFGYAPNAAYYLRYEMPEKQGDTLLAPTQTVTSNSRGQIYANYAFDPGLTETCPSGCYLALYDNPGYFPPELAFAQVALRAAMQPVLTPSQGVPTDTIAFTVNNLEAGTLTIDLGGQVVYGPVTVAAGSHSSSFTVPLYPRGLPGEVLDVTFLNLVGSLANGAQVTSFTLLAAPAEPEYQFANLVITPDYVIPGGTFTITGQIVSTKGEAIVLSEIEAQAAALNASWALQGTGDNFPISEMGWSLEPDGSFTITGRGASTALGDAFSLYDNLSVNMMGRVRESDFSGDIFAPHPLTETLQVQAINVSEGAPIPVGDPVPGAIVSLEYICDALVSEQGRATCGYHSDFWATGIDEPGLRAVEQTLVDVREATSHWGQLTDAGGNAHVVFEGEKLFDSPLNLQTLDSLYGEAGLDQFLGTQEAGWYPDEPGWQKYKLTVYGREVRFFYHDPALPDDSMTTFSTTLWFKPPGSLKDQYGNDLELHEPYVVEMHYIEAGDPKSWGPLITMSTSIGKYLGKVYDGWPAYSGFMDLAALVDSGVTMYGLPTIEVTVSYDPGMDSLVSPELWLDEEKLANFYPTGFGSYKATFPYPTEWAALPAGVPHDLALYAEYPHGELDDPIERHVYLYVQPAALWLVDTQEYSNRYATYLYGTGFAFSGMGVNPGQDSYGPEVSTTEQQTPQTGPMVNNLVPQGVLNQTVDFMGNASNAYAAGALAPQALSQIGGDLAVPGYGSPIHFYEDFEPLIYVVLPLWAGALSDPLGGWIVTITSGAYAQARVNLYIMGDIYFEPTSGDITDASVTVDARAWTEGTIFLRIDVLLGFLATGSMTLNPGMGLGMPLTIHNGEPEVGTICFRFAMDMSYYIGGLCGCIPWTDICDCLFEDEDTINLFDSSLPGPCDLPTFSEIVPGAWNYGPPAPGEEGCTSNAPSAVLPPQYRPMMATDGLGAVTAVWQGNQHNLHLADFNDNGWVTHAYSITTLGVDLPAVAFYQPDKSVITWNAYDGDENILPTLPFTEAMQTAYVAWGLKDGETFTEMGVLAENENGAGGAVLASCMDNTAGCPDGGQVTAAWLVDRVPGMVDMRSRLYYSIFENNTWSAQAAIPLDSNDSDTQPQVVYMDGQPLILFIRDADGSFDTDDDRHLAIFDPANPTVVEIPADLPGSIVEFSAAVVDGELRLAFTRIDMPEVGLIDNRHPLYTAEQTCSGTCTWAYLKLLDSHGRDIYAESPQLTINIDGEASIAYRAMGMGPLSGENGNAFDFAPFRGDTAGLILRTGEQASLNLSNFGQHTVTPGYLTGDGAVNWQTASVYDPIRGQTFQMGVRFGLGVQSEAFADLNTHLGVTAQPMAPNIALTFATLTDEPDFAVYAEAPASPYIAEGQTTVITVTVQNLGMGWDGAGQPLRIAASWDDPDGEGKPAGEALIDAMGAGSSVTVTLVVTAPFDAASAHTLYIEALPSGLVTERSSDNNTDTLVLGGLPAPQAVSVAGQNGVEFTILSWMASPDERVTSYRIYRSVDGGDYEAVGSALETQWIDLLALVDHTYSYYVTAFTADGNESPASGTVLFRVTNVVVLPKVFLPMIKR